MNPKKVGLTGGMASGKSYVRSVFEDLGVPCIDCDLVARNIHQDPEHRAMIDIKREFPSAMTPDGRLATSVMRDLLGSDLTANDRLQAIITPHLRETLQIWTEQQDSPYVIWESAIMIESGANVDRLLVVDVEPEVQMARILARNPDWSETQIHTMLGLQMGRDHRLNQATDVIQNSKTPHYARSQVMALHRMYKEIWKENG
jgi:dephospho-CoA kinase